MFGALRDRPSLVMYSRSYIGGIVVMLSSEVDGGFAVGDLSR